MRTVTFLPVLLILLLVPLSSCLLSLRKLVAVANPSSAPRIEIEWHDTVREDEPKVMPTYVVKITRVATTVPTVPWSLRNQTDQLAFVAENLEIAATYNVEITTSDGKLNTGGIVETPVPLALHTVRIFVLMVRNPRANNTALLAYKLPNATFAKSKFPDPNTSSDIIKLIYRQYNSTGITEQVLIGTNETSGPNDEYRNIMLDPESKYAFTQRFEIDGTNYFYPWSDAILAHPELAGKDSTSADRVGVIVGITAAIVGAAFIVVCILNWKYSLRYRPKPKKGKPLEKLITDPAILVTEDDFFDHLCQMKLHNFKGFYEEFSSIKKNEFQNAEAFRDSGNQHKNRFLNIPCYDSTRVHLQQGTTNYDSYIHANFVPGAHDEKEYIYTQSPLPETVDDFWSMVWQQECDIIVMIGQLIEKDKQECATYFPDDDNTLKSYCEVTLSSRHETAYYTIRKFILTKDDEKTNVTHYQYHGWPTNKMTPEYPTSFLRMINRISKSIPERPGKPIIVHGTNDRHGRAGIYICIDSQIQRFLVQYDVSVYGGVVTCNTCRHDGVKTLDEYIFIHDAVSEAVQLKRIDSITVDALPKYIENACKGTEGVDLFMTEFDFLTSPPMSSTQKMAIASQVCNAPKNRYSNVKPYDYNRVKLKKLKNQEGSDYINASYVDTYKRISPFIAAQAPLVETIADFWRMIYETESWVIVMLGQEIEGGQLKANRFWPEEGHALKLGDITVKFSSIARDTFSGVWIRQMELMGEGGEPKLIQFYQYQEWPSQKAINSQSIRGLLTLLDQSESWKQKLNAKFITVVSSSGIGRPGVLIALATLQEEAEGEGAVNVFRTVQQLNQQRLSLVQTSEEYSLTYTATLEITENARREGRIQEVHVNVDDVGSTLGIDLKTNASIESKPSIEEDTSESEKPADIIIEPAPSTKPADIIEPADKIELAPKDDLKKKPSVSFQMEGDETDETEKKPLGRVNTKSYESQM